MHNTDDIYQTKISDDQEYNSVDLMDEICRNVDTTKAKQGLHVSRQSQHIYSVMKPQTTLRPDVVLSALWGLAIIVFGGIAVQMFAAIHHALFNNASQLDQRGAECWYAGRRFISVFVVRSVTISAYMNLFNKTQIYIRSPNEK